jgi:hypothetical protein
MCSAALLMFHDAVESFLLMTGEHLGAPSTYEFEKYWRLPLPGGAVLPVQQGMTRLNKLRVALKHHGGHPSPNTISVVTAEVSERKLSEYLYDKEAARRNPRLNELIAEQVSQVTKTTALLQEAVRVATLGVDYADYRRFLGLIPDRAEMITGRRVYTAPEGYAPSADDIRFCLQFVVDIALRLATAEAQLNGIRSSEPVRRWVTLLDTDPPEGPGEVGEFGD